MGKYYRVGKATDDSMAHAHSMLDTYGYKHTLGICDTYFFLTATMVARTRLTVTLYVYDMACLYLFSSLMYSVFKNTSDLRQRINYKHLIYSKF